MYTKQFVKIKYPIIIFVLVILIILAIYFNSAVGWYGYEKWKYRRATFGNKIESIQRKVFIKNLEYSSSIELDSFNIYIEKGFKYGYHSSQDTRLLQNDKYPFQITFTDRVGKNHISYYIINKEKFDSIDAVTIYLKENYRIDTIPHWRSFVDVLCPPLALVCPRSLVLACGEYLLTLENKS